LLLVAILTEAIAALVFQSRVREVIHHVEEPTRDLELLTGVIRLIEDQTFTSPRLVAIQRALTEGPHRASAEIRRLEQRSAMLASRENVMFALPAALLMWGTQLAFAVEAWRARAGAHVPGWLDAVGEFEALSALATFAGEHEEYAYPELAPGGPCVSAEGLAHPLLDDRAVANDVALGGAAPRLLVVSGSNMSGKSTFLRALGVNVVLAQAGAPVRARRFRLSPLTIGASIRLDDSLSDGRSRFFTEITRLKHVVDLARDRRGATLFLFDEILGGTNSHDRRLGDEALLVQLVSLDAIGLVTTHDLALGEIVDRLAGRAANVHFEDAFQDGRLMFDYRLRPGLVRTSNAIELMRSIGFDI
jgi:DNA mismatch repair ATPase MutS